MKVTEMKINQLRVCAYPDRNIMGASAAQEAVAALKALLAVKDEVNVIFAAAPSQSEFLAGLCAAEGVHWEKINAFHMDEYVGLPVGSAGSFTNFLNEAVFNRLPFKQVYRLNGAAKNPAEECARYSQLLKDHSADIVFMGVGENGHIAFNDPPVADFQDPHMVKIVQLDDACRMQQVHDGCFHTFDDVPTHAFTLTVPTLFACRQIFCMVPAPTKAAAIDHMLRDEISTACPATILRNHENATLYLDADSAELYLSHL